MRSTLRHTDTTEIHHKSGEHRDQRDPPNEPKRRPITHATSLDGIRKYSSPLTPSPTRTIARYNRSASLDRVEAWDLGHHASAVRMPKTRQAGHHRLQPHATTALVSDHPPSLQTHLTSNNSLSSAPKGHLIEIDREPQFQATDHASGFLAPIQASPPAATLRHGSMLLRRLRSQPRDPEFDYPDKTHCHGRS